MASVSNYITSRVISVLPFSVFPKKSFKACNTNTVLSLENTIALGR